MGKGNDKKVQGETLCCWLEAINCSGIFLYFFLFFFFLLGPDSNVMNLLETTGIRFNLTYLHTHTHMHTQNYQADCIFKLVESIV